LLKPVLGRACLTYEELVIVLADCECVMNSRPLTYLSKTEPINVTPSMFLQRIQECSVTDIDAVDHKTLNKRVRCRQSVQKDLRNRFRSEYLGLLVQKTKPKSVGFFRVGQIVLVGSDDKNRISWPLGRIIDVIPRRDKEVRLFSIKTEHSILIRPIQGILPLRT